MVTKKPLQILVWLACEYQELLFLFKGGDDCAQAATVKWNKNCTSKSSGSQAKSGTCFFVPTYKGKLAITLYISSLMVGHQTAKQDVRSLNSSLTVNRVLTGKIMGAVH